MSAEYHIPVKEFKEWATNQSWICIKQEKSDSDKEFVEHERRKIQDDERRFTYLTPTGLRVLLFTRGDEILKDG